ncbi:MAG: DNA-binding domain-containing protein [Sedimenticola sp.]|nr:DNA-binding domain-containing protein [Sedimenticola sp.]
MSPLAELQQAFCDALISPKAPSESLLKELVDDGLALQRFNVYRNNFIVLNGDALADMYPVIKRLIGEEAFRVLASAYVRQHPPQERALLLYGDQFPGFLESIPELSELPYLADVARIEYAWTESYHTQDQDNLSEKQVSEIATDKLGECQLLPHPSLHCISSAFPIYAIWQTNQSDDSTESISLDQGESHVIVLRPAIDVEVREVSRGAYHFLKQLQSGNSIDQAYETANELDDTFDPGRFLTKHLFDGTFYQITPSS